MDARTILIRPVISEKSYALIAEGKYTFRVDDRAHKTQIAQAVEEVFGVDVAAGADREGALEAEAPRPHQRPHPRLEEGDRPARAGRADRAVRGRRDRLGDLRDAEPQNQTDQPGTPLRDLPAARAADRVRAGKEADRGPAQVRRPQRQRPRHRPPPRRRRQAALPQDRLQAAQGRRAREGRDDRVRPQPHLLHRPPALRRRAQGLHPRPVAAGGRRRSSNRVPRPTSNRATRWRWARCRPAPSSTTSS